MSVTCDRSMVFSRYSGFLHQENWPPRYCWNIVESGVKHQNPNPLIKNYFYFVISTVLHNYKYSVSSRICVLLELFCRCGILFAGNSFWQVNIIERVVIVREVIFYNQLSGKVEINAIHITYCFHLIQRTNIYIHVVNSVKATIYKD